MRSAKGFTLVEIIMTMMILSLCFVATLHAVSSSTILSNSSWQITQGTLLVQEVREWSINQPFDQLSAMEQTSATPRSSLGMSLTDVSGWTETIDVTYRDPNNVRSTVVGPTDIAHVQVSVAYNGDNILTSGWLVTNR